MGESLIIRKGGGLPGGMKLNKVFKTELIGINQNYIIPRAINNEISVRIFGGGAAGGEEGGGGSGWMNNAIFTNLTPGQVIPITIGVGGRINGQAGGTTSFGSYLSANGGSGGDGGSGGGGGQDGGNGYQFGGGGGGYNGGNGGKWGGGGGAGSGISGTNGGHGGEYGGGGGGVGHRYGIGFGGNGGTYGGGGGGGAYMVNKYKYGGLNGGIGGKYGGNGGKGRVGKKSWSKLTENIPAEDGTNTFAWTNVFIDNGIYFRGAGKAGALAFDFENTDYNFVSMGGSGGGGFGGNGGKGGYIADSINTSAGGGGGGYGSNGGNGYSYS